MAKKVKADEQKSGFDFPFTRENYLILILGLLIIVAGYIFMAMPDHPDDPLTLTVAPILIIIAMTIVIPFGIMYRKKQSS